MEPDDNAQLPAVDGTSTAAPVSELTYIEIIGHTRPWRQAELIAQLPGGLEQWTAAQRAASAAQATAFLERSAQICDGDNRISAEDFKARLQEDFPGLPDEAYSDAYEDSLRDLLF